MAEAQENLLIVANNLKGIETLYRLGYRGKADVAASRLDRRKAEGARMSAMNALSNATANLKKLERYDYRMQKMQLEADLATAKRNLKQVSLVSEAELAQAPALTLKLVSLTTELAESELARLCFDDVLALAAAALELNFVQGAGIRRFFTALSALAADPGASGR